MMRFTSKPFQYTIILMIVYKLIAVSLVILTPIFSYVVTTVLRLKRFGILFTDLATPILAIDIFLIARQCLDSSVFFYYTMCLALLAIGLVGRFFKKNIVFSYRRFLKLFWRLAFLLTFAFYLIMVLVILVIRP